MLLPAGVSLTTIWHLYLLECADDSLYTGIATDVERRFQEHLSGHGARYTRSHPPVRLLASRPVGSRSAALKAEAAIKRLPKGKKLAALDWLRPIGPVNTNHIHLRRNQTMNKSELIDIVAKEGDLSKATAEKAVAAAINAIVKAVAKGDSVTLIGFGAFKSTKRAARIGKNPRTGAALKIPAATVPKFSAGATFKAAVAGKKAAKKK